MCLLGTLKSNMQTNGYKKYTPSLHTIRISCVKYHLGTSLIVNELMLNAFKKSVKLFCLSLDELKSDNAENPPSNNGVSVTVCSVRGGVKVCSRAWGQAVRQNRLRCLGRKGEGWSVSRQIPVCTPVVWSPDLPVKSKAPFDKTLPIKLRCPPPLLLLPCPHLGFVIICCLMFFFSSSV